MRLKRQYNNITSMRRTSSLSLQMTQQQWGSWAKMMKQCTGRMSNDLRLVLNMELIIDLQITQPEHAPLSISDCTVEKWNNTYGVVEWSQQRVHFLRKLKQTSLSPSILLTFYKGIVASVLSYCMSTWYSSCRMTDKNTLQTEWETLTGSLVCLCPRFLPESLQKVNCEHCQAPHTPSP